MPTPRSLAPLLRRTCRTLSSPQAIRSYGMLSSGRGTLSTHPANSLRPASRLSRMHPPATSVRYASSTSDLKQTPLYEMHSSAGAKLVPFAGFSMPLTYPDQSQSESHKWTRENASLFDVSHMVQHKMSGPLACRFLETITPSGLTSLEKHHSTLSTLLDSNGGIVDDTVITRLGRDSFYFVTNAGCREGDLKFLNEQLQSFLQSQDAKGDQVNWHILDHHSLLALQGPKAAEVLQPLVYSDPDDDTLGTKSSRSGSPNNPTHIEPELPTRYLWNLWSYAPPPQAFDYNSRTSSLIPELSSTSSSDRPLTPPLLTQPVMKTDTDLSTLYFGQSRWLQLTIPENCNKEHTELSTPSLLISRTGMSSN